MSTSLVVRLLSYLGGGGSGDSKFTGGGGRWLDELVLPMSTSLMVSLLPDARERGESAGR